MATSSLRDRQLFVGLDAHWMPGVPRVDRAITPGWTKFLAGCSVFCNKILLSDFRRPAWPSQGITIAGAGEGTQLLVFLERLHCD